MFEKKTSWRRTLIWDLIGWAGVEAFIVRRQYQTGHSAYSMVVTFIASTLVWWLLAAAMIVYLTVRKEPADIHSNLHLRGAAAVVFVVWLGLEALVVGRMYEADRPTRAMLIYITTTTVGGLLSVGAGLIYWKRRHSQRSP